MKNFIYSRYNAYMTFASLAMVGSGVAFLVLSFLFWVRSHGSDWQPVAVPELFWGSALVLFACSVMLICGRRFFLSEAYSLAYRFFSAALLFCMVFTFCQFAGWAVLISNPSNPTAHLFIVLLSFFHFLHIIAGLCALIPIWVKLKNNQTYINGFVESMDAELRAKMKAVVWYWHFLDALWLFLMLIFYNQS